jgi:hypothetical protein
MPRRTPFRLADHLRRLIKLDAALASGGLVHLKRFAEGEGITVRQVKRYLELFRALGHAPVVKVLELDGKVREWTHRYEKDEEGRIRPVFTRNIPIPWRYVEETLGDDE